MDWSDLKKRKLEGKELVIAVAQDYENMNVAMVAFQDKEAFERTRKTGELHLYSTSKKKQWKKGEVSGNVMLVKETRVDCDGDALLYIVELTGGACHEGYESCFHRSLSGKTVGKKIFDPNSVYLI
jgi:phosphoribosyl-AMP cyclohydrolase